MEQQNFRTEFAGIFVQWGRMTTGILVALLFAACVIAAYYAYEVKKLRAKNLLPTDHEIEQIHIASNQDNQAITPASVIMSDDYGNILLKSRGSIYFAIFDTSGRKFRKKY
ncbi:hypothetical protein [Sphingobium yanoikuyae]|uniref:hypothetical protein n=1 Tax=Sphingobium yanoikuyae TaxID=13690 RepID=UPI001110D041|nr:hypothetical protein [Sphingobium yanoikuyae]